jgi:hypothetical protein
MTPAVHALTLHPRLAVADEPAPAPSPRTGPQPAVLGMALEMLRVHLPCVHCGRVPASRRRGLCNGCYMDRAVREATPVVNKFGQRGAGASARSHPPPAKSTKARPGGKGKLAVLAARAQAGQELFHPNDRSVRCRRPLHGSSSSCRTTARVSRETL